MATEAAQARAPTPWRFQNRGDGDRHREDDVRGDVERRVRVA